MQAGSSLRSRSDSPVQWDADDRTLYVWRRGGLPAVVDRMVLTTGTRQPWKKLMPEDPAGVVAIDAVVVSRDGLSCAYSCTRVTASDLYVVDELYKSPRLFAVVRWPTLTR